MRGGSILTKKKMILGIICAAAAIAVLWAAGIIPKWIGRYTATEYVRENYQEMGLQFENIEFSSAYGDYIASFADEDNKIYNFRLFSGQLPFSVAYDSIKQSVV